MTFTAMLSLTMYRNKDGKAVNTEDVEKNVELNCKNKTVFIGINRLKSVVVMFPFI